LKLLRDFDAFLRDTVNVTDGQVEQLDTHVRGIETFLRRSDVLGTVVVRTIPQGSWVHRTIIRPLPGKTFDADILLELVHQPDWEPRGYINGLYSKLGDSPVYRDMVKRKNRCVRVEYAGAEHVDVVPFTVIAGIGNITNRDDNIFEPTDPQGFSRWMRDHDELASGNLRRVIRLLKFLRDFKERFSVKSVILTTLAGERVTATRKALSPDCYSDVPMTLKTIITDLADHLARYPDRPPSVPDPSGGNRTFDHRWDQRSYPAFRESMAFYAERVTLAYDEPDLERSVALWQDIFGPEFVHQQDRRVIKAAETGAVITGRDPGEEFVEERFPVRLVPSASMQIQCDVTARAGFRSGDLSAMHHRIGKHRTLDFSASVRNVQRPFDIYWKVKNSGSEAREASALRGRLQPDAGLLRRRETTLYTGEHYVECCVVKDGACVARSRRYPVIIG
jgi:Adenylyl/Guanylyl and SMODS C-terminal sensor domain/Second Messenger Oligonucleotide or Dinucleotide Synthetase domain